MNYARTVLRGAGVTLAFTLAAALVAYLTRLVLARHLTPADFGLFYAVFTFVIFFLFFRDFGFDQALVKFIAEFKAKNKLDEVKTAIAAVFFWQLLASLLLGITFFFLSDYLALHYFKDPRAALLLQLLTLYIVGSVFFTVFKQALQGLQEIALFSSIELVKNILVLLLVIVFFWRGYAVFAPAWAFVLVCFLLGLIYSFFFFTKFSFFRQKTTAFMKISKDLFFFSIPIFATAVGGKIIGYIDTLMLTYYRTLTEVGIYNVVLPSALIFLFFSRAINAVIFPISTELWVKKDMPRLRKGWDVLNRYTFILLIPVLITLGYYARNLLGFFFGPEYMAGARALQILLPGIAFLVIASANQNILVGMGKPKLVTGMIIIAALLNVAINFYAIPAWGIEGAALATLFSYLSMLIFSTVVITLALQSSWPWKNWLLLILPAASYLGMLWLLERSLPLSAITGFVFSVLSASIVYVLLLFIFRLLVFKELYYYLHQVR